MVPKRIVLGHKKVPCDPVTKVEMLKKCSPFGGMSTFTQQMVWTFDIYLAGLFSAGEQRGCGTYRRRIQFD